MRTFNYILFIFIITLFPVFVYGQQAVDGNNRGWSLSDCVSYGMEHSLTLQIGLNDSEKEKLSYRQSKWQLAPSISGWSNGNLNLRRSTDQNNQISSGSSYSISYGLNASLTLFDGFSRINQISAMKFNSLAYRTIAEQQKNLLYLEIVKGYALSVYNRQQVKITEEQLELVKKQKEKIESKVAVGLMGAASIDEVNATLSANQWKVDKQKNSFSTSQLSLTQLIDLPDTTKFELNGMDFDMIVPTPMGYTTEKVYEQACNHLPDLKEKEFRLQYYKKELRVSQGSLLPSLSLSGDYYSQFYSTDSLANGNTTPLAEQYDNYLNPSLTLSLTIPIFKKRSNEFEIKKSRIDIENAILELEIQKKEIYKEIQSALQLLNDCYLEYLSAVDNLNYVEKSFNINSEKYTLGLINSTDFITAQNQLLEARTNMLAAKYTWIVQDKTIRLYSGIREF